MLPLPKDPTNILKLADWMELTTLLVADSNVSANDLESTLRSAAIFRENIEIESITLDVFKEVERRSLAAGYGYPFEINGSVISFKGNIRKYNSYIFCLCLSYLGLNDNSAPRKFPERLFEDLACEAAKSYVCGNAIRFGWPRHQPLPHQFNKAVDSICKSYIKEGRGFKNQDKPQKNGDAQVDIIAWKDFPDNRSGKIILFGACAAGNDWDGNKRTELHPDAFCGNWMIDSPPSSVIKAYFIPHRVQEEFWDRHTRTSGIIFDRCRISFWTAGHKLKSYDIENANDWVKKVLKKAK